MNFSDKLIQAVKNAGSVEELAKMAKDAGFDLTAEEAKSCYDKLCASVELTDAALKNVAGGSKKNHEIGFLD